MLLYLITQRQIEFNQALWTPKTFINDWGEWFYSEAEQNKNDMEYYKRNGK